MVAWFAVLLLVSVIEVVPTLPDADAFYVDKSRPDTLKQMQHMDVDPYFRDYQQQSRWRRLAEDLVGEPVTGGAPEWFNKPAGTNHPTPPHQDANYLPDPALWIAWIPLDDCPLDRGPLAVVPGSHEGGLRPHEGATLDEREAESRAGDRWVAAALQPGDALFFSALTLHRSLDNRTERLRLSVDLRFAPG